MRAPWDEARRCNDRCLMMHCGLSRAGQTRKMWRLLVWLVGQHVPAARYSTCMAPRRCWYTCLTSRRAKLYMGRLERANRSGHDPRPSSRETAARAVQVVLGVDDPTYLIGIFRGRSCDIFERPRKGTHAPGAAFSAKSGS
jgi:hypothetical protein